MNEADIPIDIHTLKLQDWLISRRIVPKHMQAQLKDIRTKISNALQDMPSNEELIKLLSGKNINYFHCKQIIEILKNTEKDTKSVFGTYGSQRMRDWQEILRLYEKENIYLAEWAQLFVRNVNYELPNVRKQMTKLEQQTDEALKRAQDLSKPEAQMLAEHAALLQQLGVKGENLREEFLQAVEKLPALHAASISTIAELQDAIKLYAEFSKDNPCLPILRHIIEFGNTTVYQYMHKEAPLRIEETAIKMQLTQVAAEANDNNEIDFGASDDNGGTSSTVSAEMIDFGDLDEPNDGGDIDWGIDEGETANAGENTAIEVNFDIPIEEYGIVVENAGMDGGVAKGEQAYTLLDSPNYRDRFLDELYELEAFLRMRRYELQQLENSTNFLLGQMDNFSTHDIPTIEKWLKSVDTLIANTDGNKQLRHLMQLKHSPKYADLLAKKLAQMMKSVERIRRNRSDLRQRAEQLKQERAQLNPVLAELIAQTKEIQQLIEADVSKRYKNRVVNLIGGVN